MMGVKVHVISVGAFEANCIVASDETGNAWVTDPGAEGSLIAKYLSDSGLKLRRILLTHGHIDHISALGELLAQTTSIPVMLHGEDAEWAFSDRNIFPPYSSVPARPPSLCFYDEGDTLCDGSLCANILHTPGHSPGSVCIMLSGGPLLSGDTLFAMSVGRTDLPGGNGSKLAKSLRRLVGELDEQVEVIPGHGPTTSIGREREENPFISLSRRHGGD